MLVDAYDDKTARVWLFGTNTSPDDGALIEVLGTAIDTAESRWSYGPRGFSVARPRDAHKSS